MNDSYWTPKIIDAVKNNRYLRKDKNSGLYLIDANTVAQRDSEESVHHANFIANLALKERIHVPQVLKLVGLEERVMKELNQTDSDNWFFVYRFINGKDANHYMNKNSYASEKEYEQSNRIRIEIPRQLKTQMQKLLDLRIYPGGLLDGDSVKGDKLIFNNPETILSLIGYKGWRPILRMQEYDQMVRLIKQNKIDFV